MAYKRSKGSSIVGGRKKKHTYKGIDYKSSLEKNMAMILDREGIEFEYEAYKFDLLDSFHFPVDCYERQANGKGDMINRGNKKVNGISYTPDFVGDGFYIETKGYANESFPLRWKLFKSLLADDPHSLSDVALYKPQKISECETVVKLIKERYEQRGRNK